MGVPVDAGRFEHRAEQIVHRGVAVEVAHEPHDVVAVDDVCTGIIEQMTPTRRIAAVEFEGPMSAADHQAVTFRSASRRTTSGNSTLFSLWMCRCVSASISAIAAKHAAYDAQPSAGGV